MRREAGAGRGVGLGGLDSSVGRLDHQVDPDSIHGRANGVHVVWADRGASLPGRGVGQGPAQVPHGDPDASPVIEDKPRELDRIVVQYAGLYVCAPTRVGAPGVMDPADPEVVSDVWCFHTIVPFCPNRGTIPLMLTHPSNLPMLVHAGDSTVLSRGWAEPLCCK